MYLDLADLTHLQDGIRKLKFMLRILEKNHVGSETESVSGSETKWKREWKNHSISTTLNLEVVVVPGTMQIRFLLGSYISQYLWLLKMVNITVFRVVIIRIPEQNVMKVSDRIRNAASFR